MGFIVKIVEFMTDVYYFHKKLDLKCLSSEYASDKTLRGHNFIMFFEECTVSRPLVTI